MKAFSVTTRTELSETSTRKTQAYFVLINVLEFVYVTRLACEHPDVVPFDPSH